MVRSMYSGVSGLRSHQQRLDVIGNNVSNVNTYGFKSSRATFRDMFYQNVRNAAQGTSSRGGINPSAIGYGASLSSVDLLMEVSSMTPTGNPLDVAITGEGFLQVMDNDGNIFYTRAGMLDVDPTTGYLVDGNGYFVLGTQAKDATVGIVGQEPGTSRIKIELPTLDAKQASVTKKIGGNEFTMTATNIGDAGNASINFSLAYDMPAGQDIEVVISGNNIEVNVNPTSTFANVGTFMDQVNTMITDKLGETHPAGKFELNMDPPITVAGNPAYPGDVITGEQLVKSDAGPTGGMIALSPDAQDRNIQFIAKKLGSAFSGDTAGAQLAITHDTATDLWSVAVGDYKLEGITLAALTGSAGVMLKNTATGADENDYFTISIPKSALDLKDPDDPAAGYADSTTVTLGDMTPQRPSGNLGLNAGFQLEGGTEGGPQTIMNITGFGIGADGTLTGQAGGERLIFGRIDLANFDNPKGLQQSGNSYFAETQNSGKPQYAVPGEDGTGALKNSALEMSNVDLANEFSDMITTQRGYQANSRLITVSDTMLEELINLKR
ncbi:MAG: flagellar hook-basal body complex protein [Anaerotruncus sp.]|nr:flagellar hook-basal body complex protein [Anaerotruncus sp.]MCI9236614.1 flagellar hook-basal body complex protein [Anaerotruncus sp.]